MSNLFANRRRILKGKGGAFDFSGSAPLLVSSISKRLLRSDFTRKKKKKKETEEEVEEEEEEARTFRTLFSRPNSETHM